MFLRRILLCLLGLSTLCAHAQENAQEACLKNFSAVALPGESLSADFQMMKSLPGLAQPLPAKGRVVAVPDQGLIWLTTFPLREVRVFGKERVVTTDEKGELQTQDVRASGPFASLLGASREELLESLQQSFFISCFSKDLGQTLILSPKPGPLAKYVSEMSFESTDKNLTKAVITQTNKTVTRIEFRNPVRPAAVTGDDAALLNRVR